MIEKDRWFLPAAQGGGLITRRPTIQFLEMFASGHPRMLATFNQLGKLATLKTVDFSWNLIRF
jgi:hypothetical protein